MKLEWSRSTHMHMLSVRGTMCNEATIEVVCICCCAEKRVSCLYYIGIVIMCESAKLCADFEEHSNSLTIKKQAASTKEFVTSKQI